MKKTSVKEFAIPSEALKLTLNNIQLIKVLPYTRSYIIFCYLDHPCEGRQVEFEPDEKLVKN